MEEQEIYRDLYLRNHLNAEGLRKYIAILKGENISLAERTHNALKDDSPENKVSCTNLQNTEPLIDNSQDTYCHREFICGETGEELTCGKQYDFYDEEEGKTTFATARCDDCVITKEGEDE